jgi:acyl-CoA thioesterase
MKTQGLSGWIVAGVVLLFGTSGCGQKKLTECDALIKVINAGVQAIEKTPKSEADPTGVSDLKAMAEAMDRVASETGHIPLTIPEIRKFSTDYQKMVKDIARAERDLAVAAQERDQPKRSVAEAALEAAVKQEDPLVDTINKYCQAP